MRLQDLISVASFPAVLSGRDIAALRQISAADHAGAEDHESVAEFLGGYLNYDAPSQHALRATLSSLSQTRNGGAFWINGVFGSGKSHLLGVLSLLGDGAGDQNGRRNHETFALSHPDCAGFLGFAPRFSLHISLDEWDAARFGLEEIFWRELNAEWTRRGLEPLQIKRSGAHIEDFAALETALRERGFEGLVVCFDELSLFLSARAHGPLQGDAAWLQFLGTHTRRAPLWVFCALQKTIDDISGLERYSLSQIRDRFTLLPLSLASIGALVQKRLIRVRPDAAPALDELCAQTFARLQNQLPRLDFGPQDWRASFPFHPATLRALEAVTGRFFSRTRSAALFCCRAIDLEVDAKTRITPDQIWDYFAPELESHPDLRPLLPVFHAWNENLEQIFDLKDRQNGLRVMKWVLLCKIAGQPVTPVQTANALDFNLDLSGDGAAEYARFLLERIAARGSYLAVERGDLPIFARYTVDLGRRVGEMARRAVAAALETLAPNDARIGAHALACCRTSALPLAELGAPRSFSTFWHHAPRSLSVEVWDGAGAQNLANRAAQTREIGAPDDAVLAIWPPFFAPTAPRQNSASSAATPGTNPHARAGISTASGVPTGANFPISKAVGTPTPISGENLGAVGTPRASRGESLGASGVPRGAHDEIFEARGVPLGAHGESLEARGVPREAHEQSFGASGTPREAHGESFGAGGDIFDAEFPDFGAVSRPDLAGETAAEKAPRGFFVANNRDLAVDFSGEANGDSAGDFSREFGEFGADFSSDFGAVFGLLPPEARGALWGWKPRAATRDEWELAREGAAAALAMSDPVLLDNRRGRALLEHLQKEAPARDAQIASVALRLLLEGEILVGAGAALEASELARGDGFGALLEAIGDFGWPQIFPQFLAIAPRARILTPSNADSLCLEILRRPAAEPFFAASLERLARHLGEPLGVAKSGSGRWKIAGGKPAINAQIREIVGEETTYAALEAALAKSDFGLKSEQTAIALCALLRGGELAAFDPKGQELAPASIGLPLRRALHWVRPARHLSAAQWATIAEWTRELCDFTPQFAAAKAISSAPDRLEAAAGAPDLAARDAKSRAANASLFAAPDFDALALEAPKSASRAPKTGAAGAQNPAPDFAEASRVAGALLEWREGAAQIADLARARAAQLRRALHQTPESWAEFEGACEALGAVLETIPPRGVAFEVLSRVAEVELEPLRAGLAAFRRFDGALSEKTAPLLGLGALLHHPELVAPPDLGESRRELLERLGAGENALFDADLVARGAAWSQSYARQYSEWHAAQNDAARWNGWRRLAQSDAARALERLGALQNRSFGGNFRSQIEAELGARCARESGLAGGEAVCASCGLRLGGRITVRDVGELESALSREMESVRAVLNEASPRGFLARHNSPFGSWNGDASELLPLLSGANLRLLDEALAPRRRVSRSGAALLASLPSGAAKSEIERAFAAWLDGGEGLGAGDEVEIGD